MNKFKLSRRSLEKLQKVHPDLVKVVLLAIELTEVDFGVTEGVRTIERQRELFAKGASKTMNSRHLTGHAVDLVAYVGSEVRWDWGLYLKIAEAMKLASEQLKIPVRWGGTWDLLYNASLPVTASALSKSFPDGPHFELPRGLYP